jgi:hypothetical protein
MSAPRKATAAKKAPASKKAAPKPAETASVWYHRDGSITPAESAPSVVLDRPMQQVGEGYEAYQARLAEYVTQRNARIRAGAAVLS